MIAAQTNKTTTVTLTLDERAARWLRNLMQNPMSDAESVEDAAMRLCLFECLPNMNDNQGSINASAVLAPLHVAPHPTQLGYYSVIRRRHAQVDEYWDRLSGWVSGKAAATATPYPSVKAAESIAHILLEAGALTPPPIYSRPYGQA